jgi:hypothetical protein
LKKLFTKILVVKKLKISLLREMEHFFKNYFQDKVCKSKTFFYLCSPKGSTISENSSAGRAQPCQG